MRQINFNVKFRHNLRLDTTMIKINSVKINDCTVSAVKVRIQNLGGFAEGNCFRLTCQSN